MNVSVPCADLLEALNIAATVAPVRSPIGPLISAVKIDAEGEHVDFTASDLETGVVLRIQGVTVKSPGTAAVNCTKLLALIASSTSKNCQISTDAGNLSVKIKLDDCASKLAGMDPSDYPAIPKWESKDSVKIPCDGLAEAVRLTKFCASSESARGPLIGQHFDMSQRGTLVISSSDGRRLAMMRSKVDGPVGPKTTIPVKAMTLLEKSIGEGAESVSLLASDSSIMFKTSNNKVFVFSRTLEGRYPDVGRVISVARENCKKTVKFDRLNLLAAVKRCSIATEDLTKAVKITLSKGSATLLSRAPSVGEVETKIDADYKGSEVSITFNPDCLADYLSTVDGESVSLLIAEKDKAAIFSCGKKEYDYLVMPLTIEV